MRALNTPLTHSFGLGLVARANLCESTHTVMVSSQVYFEPKLVDGVFSSAKHI